MAERNPFGLTRLEVRAIRDLGRFSLEDLLPADYPSTATALLQKLSLLDKIVVPAIEGLIRVLPQYASFESQNKPDAPPFRFMTTGNQVLPAWRRLAANPLVDQEEAITALTVPFSLEEPFERLTARAELTTAGPGHRAFGLLRWGRTDEGLEPFRHVRVNVAEQFAVAHLASIDGAVELHGDDCQLRSMGEPGRIVEAVDFTEDEQDVFNQHGPPGLLYWEFWVCARSLSVFAAAAIEI